MLISDQLYKEPLFVELPKSLSRYKFRLFWADDYSIPSYDTHEVIVKNFSLFPVLVLVGSLLCFIGLSLYPIIHSLCRQTRMSVSGKNMYCKLFGIFAVFVMAACVGVMKEGFLFKGLSKAVTFGQKVDNIISSARYQIQELESMVGNRTRPQLIELADIFNQANSNESASSQSILIMNMIQGNISVAEDVVAGIRKPLIQTTRRPYYYANGDVLNVDMNYVLQQLGPLAYLLLYTGICWYAAYHSRYRFILFCVFGLLAAMFAVSYFSSSVAVHDFCMNPVNYLVPEAPNDLLADVLLYYIKDGSVRSNPYTLRLHDSQNAINNAMDGVSWLVMASPKSAVLRRKLDAVNDNLSNSKRLLAQLTALDDYKAIHDDYLDTVFCICSNEPIWWVLSCWNLTIPLLIIISLDWKLLLWDNKHNQIPIWWWCYL